MGGGNHFITFYEVRDVNDQNDLGLSEGDNVVLAHSGSRLVGKDVFDRMLSGSEYVSQYPRIVEWARQNREGLLDIVQQKEL